MRFYIFGGSNSIFRDGWVPCFTQYAGQQVLNRSVGATTTLTGLFRFLLSGTGGPPEEGDVVIWEYAINEVNHVARGYRRELLMKNVEHLMRLCRTRGCRFIPLIMTTRSQERASERDPYYQMLVDLFTHHGIVPFDLSKVWRQWHGKRRMPDDLYHDNAHYTRDPALMDFIAKGINKLVATARVPAPMTPLYSAGRALSLIDGLEQGVYENSLMRIPTTRIPLSITLKGRGRIAAICTLCQGDFETGIRVQLRPGSEQMRQMRFSTTNSTDRRLILKSVSLENALGERWNKLWGFENGDRLRLSPARLPGTFYAEHELRSSLVAPDRSAPAHIAGVLVEIEESPSPSINWPP